METEFMKDQAKLIESLLENATEYGKTSLEIVKLKTLDKTSDIIASFVPQAIIWVLSVSFLLFFNLGLAFWLGEILGKTYFGFFVVAAFYGIAGLIFYLFLHKWLKRLVCDYIIKQVLK
jgi:hypothetical protein